ncbi:outer membrane beta-barrel protein [Cognatilysobacter tabacisoli]|uniref:outer membrane beta-barrel protein n=1 Tax=Cognatilysobacter tabacisoli TaxID=2315424 RepID=UPI000E6B2AA7|nr:outer membrane beta-barrel protein [Lysobacter tabacisoli]
MKKHLALAVALAIAPFAASADGLDYTYIEGGYANVEIDTGDAFAGDVEFDGVQIRGSAAISESFYLLGGYGNVTNDDFGADIDFNELQFGLGYRHGLSERADLVTEVSYLRQEVDFPGGSEDTSGGRVSVGVRGLLADNFEGYVKGSYTDGGDFDGDFSGTIGAQFKFTPVWGVVGEIEAGDDVTKYLVGVRASF